MKIAEIKKKTLINIWSIYVFFFIKKIHVSRSRRQLIRHNCKFRGVEIIYLTTPEWRRPLRALLSGPWGDRRSEDENTVNSTTRRSDELWFSFLLRQAGTLHRCGSHLGWFGSFPHLSFCLMSKYHIHLVGRVGHNICFKQLNS